MNRIRNKQGRVCRGLLYGVALITMISCAKDKSSQEEASEGTQASAQDTVAQLDTALLSFKAYPANPVFTGTGANTWDRNIRERGFILVEDGTYHLWYTGFT